MSTTDPLETIGLSSKPPSKKWMLWVGLAVLSLVICVGIYVKLKPKPGLYKFESVVRRNLNTTVEAIGTLSPIRTVEVGAEISGRVEQVLVEPNQRVKKGDVLAVLDTTQLRLTQSQASANMQMSMSAVQTAQASLKEIEQRVTRARALMERELVSAQELETLEATLLRANAELQSARSRVRVTEAEREHAKTNLTKANILSPIDGIVLTRLVEPGQTVAAAFQAPVLFKIAENLEQLELKVDVDESDVGQVREGQAAIFRVDAFPLAQFSAVIRRVNLGSKVVQNVVMYEAVLAVNNTDGRLRPGMTATATITTSSREGVLCVPNAALRFAPPVELKLGGKRNQDRVTGDAVWISERDATGKDVPKAVSVTALGSDDQFTEIKVLTNQVLVEGSKVITDIITDAKP